MTEKEKYHVPQKSGGDIFYDFLKSLKPFDIILSFFSPPFERRQRQFFEEFAEGIKALEEWKAGIFYELQNNDAFIDIVSYAMQITFRSSQKEKRKALHNAIFNSALPDAPEQSIQQMFLNYIDVFTVWHLKILDLFYNIEIQKKARNKMQSKTSILSEEMNSREYNDIYGMQLYLILNAFPELIERNDFVLQIIEDLNQKNLLGKSGKIIFSHRIGSEKMQFPHPNRKVTFSFMNITTDFGKDFLKYIKNPLNNS